MERPLGGRGHPPRGRGERATDAPHGTRAPPGHPDRRAGTGASPRSAPRGASAGIDARMRAPYPWNRATRARRSVAKTRSTASAYSSARRTFLTARWTEGGSAKENRA